MLETENLRRPGLEPISLSLAEGTCIMIEGPSGAGKTLLLRMLADLDPSEGRVSLSGIYCDEIPAPQWRRLVCYLPTESGWWSDRPRNHFEDLDKVKPVLERLGMDKGVLDRSVRLLSTGERSRLALARGLEQAPRVLLLDEPTGPLDGDSVNAVEKLLLEQKESGVILVWVTHDPAQAARLADRRYKMSGGRLTEVPQ